MLRRGEDVEKARRSSSTRIGEFSWTGDNSLDRRLTIFQWRHGLAHFHHYKNIKSPVRFTERDPKWTDLFRAFLFVLHHVTINYGQLCIPIELSLMSPHTLDMLTLLRFKIRKGFRWKWLVETSPKGSFQGFLVNPHSGERADPFLSVLFHVACRVISSPQSNISTRSSTSSSPFACTHSQNAHLGCPSATKRTGFVEGMPWGLLIPELFLCHGAAAAAKRPYYQRRAVGRSFINLVHDFI